MKFDLLRAVPDRFTIAEASPLARWLAVSLLPLAALALSAGAQAQTLTVQATVQATCTATAAILDFGTYNKQTGSPTSTPLTFTDCPPNTTVSVRLDSGLTPNGTKRNMKKVGAEDLLPYNLYQDPNHSIVWGGVGSIGIAKTIGTGDSEFDNLLVYGKIELNQSVPSGGYSDTVQISVAF